MSDVDIEYCVPCGHLDHAIETQREILVEFGQRIDGVRLKTGDRGVFKIRVDGEEIFDKSQGYDIDSIKRSIRDRINGAIRQKQDKNVTSG